MTKYEIMYRMPISQALRTKKGPRTLVDPL